MPLSKQLSEEQKDQTLDWLESNVLNHPEYGRQVKRILKQVNENISFPEIDLEDHVEKRTKAIEEKLDTFTKAQKDKENKLFWENERKKATEAGYVTEEERADFEKWMIDNAIGNYQVAAKYYAETVKKPAEPTNYTERTGIQLPAMEGLASNPTQWARNEAFKALGDLERRRNGR